MQHRHFLVKEADSDYHLKEIDTGIAKGISLFGIITGQCYTVESEHWTFYFMNSSIPQRHADKIARELMENIRSSNQ